MTDLLVAPETSTDDQERLDHGLGLARGLLLALPASAVGWAAIVWTVLRLVR